MRQWLGASPKCFCFVSRCCLVCLTRIVIQGKQPGREALCCSCQAKGQSLMRGRGTICSAELPAAKNPFAKSPVKRNRGRLGKADRPGDSNKQTAGSRWPGEAEVWLSWQNSMFLNADQVSQERCTWTYSTECYRMLQKSVPNPANPGNNSHHCQGVEMKENHPGTQENQERSRFPGMET